MDQKTLVVARDVIPPGRMLHYVFRCLEEPRDLAVSIIDREGRCPDLLAEACYDAEGWIVIVLHNTTSQPVEITPLDPLRIVIFPAARQPSLSGQTSVAR